MGLTRRDAVTTVLAVVVALIAANLVQELGWPVVSDYRIATLAFWVIGVAMCPMTWWAVEAALGDAEAGRVLRHKLGLNGAYYGAMSGVALLATIALIWGIVAPSAAVALIVGAFTFGMWLAATSWHAILSVRPPELSAT